MVSKGAAAETLEKCWAGGGGVSSCPTPSLGQVQLLGSKDNWEFQQHLEPTPKIAESQVGAGLRAFPALLPPLFVSSEALRQVGIRC